MPPSTSHVNGRARFAKQSSGANDSRTLTLTVELSAEQLDAVAARVAERLQPVQPEHSTPWLNTESAAAYIDAKPARIHDLVALGTLTPRRDGRRLLFARSDLDNYVKGR